jgi:hypothetical protein
MMYRNVVVYGCVENVAKSVKQLRKVSRAETIYR